MKASKFATFASILVASLILAPVAMANPHAPSQWQPRETPAEPPTLGGGAPQGSVDDPVGDTFGGLSPQHDLTQFSAFIDGSGTNLLLGMTFDGNITPADSGMADALVGLLEMDLDQDNGTGSSPISDFFCPMTTNLGVEFLVDLGTYTDGSGQMLLVDLANGPVGNVDATFTSNSVSITVPLALLGDDGFLNTATVIGTGPEPTDCAPNGGFLTSGPAAVPVIEVPTLRTLGLGALALLLVTLGAVAIRRQS